MKNPIRMLVAVGAVSGLLACSVPAAGPSASVSEGAPVDPRPAQAGKGRLSGTVSLRGVGAAAGLEVKVYAADSGPQMPHWTTMTDAAGKYQVAVPEGRYNVLVRKPGSNLAAARFGVQADTVVDIDLVPTGEIRGKVVTKAGVDLTGAEVFVPGTDLAARTDANGAFLLGAVPFGSYTLVARRPAERILPRAVLDQGVSSRVTVGMTSLGPMTEISLIWDDQATASMGVSGDFADQPMVVEFAPHAAAGAYRLAVMNDEGQVLGEATGSTPNLAVSGIPGGLYWYQLGYSVDDKSSSWALTKPRQSKFVHARAADFAPLEPGPFVMGQAGVTNATQSVTLTRGFEIQKTHVTQG